MRDRTLPHRYRYAALRGAVGHHMPLGPRATWDYITSRAGDVRNDEGALVRALDILEVSRDARHAELAEFARRRSADKRERYQRTVPVEESRYRHGWRWPGPDAHEATLFTVKALWEEHVRAPFPDEVPPADHGDLVELDSTVAGVIWTYLRRNGNLHPDHRGLLRDCLAGLRGLSLAGRGHIGASLAFTRVRKMAELIAHDALPLIRRAWSGDAEHIADVFLAARAEMTYLPRPRSDEETRAWIADVMLPASQVWVAELHGQVAGFACLQGDRLSHLYVTPAAHRRGIGTALLGQAKKARPRTLHLHVFQQSIAARRFFERHGFSLDVDVERGGSDHEENPPGARYRWRSVDDAREPEPSRLNESLSCAFPDALAREVRAAVRVLPKTLHCPVGSFRATVGDDRVTVPGRIYNPEVSPETLDGLTPLQQTILHCLYTRHHDGFVRQHHLAQIIGRLDPWVLPYVVHLVGEYVLEIVTDIDTALGDLGTPGSPTHEAYSRFLSDNPQFLTLVQQRVASYWACYHRREFPRLADYPGHRLVTAMRAAGAFVERDR
ncbi:GNAT family N-acetyltransferase [Microbispora sp. NPDC046973]|uniref:GNAT family N-acetyltransferase n=1 Tax=Microbispora sp. NPDC046973 TaxID=3155022 RepID=UPI0033F23A97